MKAPLLKNNYIYKDFNFIHTHTYISHTLNNELYNLLLKKKNYNLSLVDAQSCILIRYHSIMHRLDYIIGGGV